MQNIRQYLRNYSKTKEGRIILRKLFNIALENQDITNDDYWILTYAYAECRMRENTCAKLHIRTTKYNSMLNEALIKINCTINKLDKIRTL